MSIRNLLNETLAVLERHGKSFEDVIAVVGIDHPVDGLGGEPPVACSFAEFAKEASFEYDASYGAVEVNPDLKIVGDGWWLERASYDGSEWWEFRAPPVIPELKRVPFLLSLECRDDDDDDCYEEEE